MSLTLYAVVLNRCWGLEWCKWEGGWENWRHLLCAVWQPKTRGTCLSMQWLNIFPMSSNSAKSQPLCSNIRNGCIIIHKSTTLSFFFFQAEWKHVSFRHTRLYYTDYSLCDAYSDLFREDVILYLYLTAVKATLYCSWKKGNHGNDIFQAGKRL